MRLALIKAMIPRVAINEDTGESRISRIYNSILTLCAVVELLGPFESYPFDVRERVSLFQLSV